MGHIATMVIFLYQNTFVSKGLIFFLMHYISLFILLFIMNSTSIKQLSNRRYNIVLAKKDVATALKYLYIYTVPYVSYIIHTTIFGHHKFCCCNDHSYVSFSLKHTKSTCTKVKVASLGKFFTKSGFCVTPLGNKLYLLYFGEIVLKFLD